MLVAFVSFPLWSCFPVCVMFCEEFSYGYLLEHCHFPTLRVVYLKVSFTWFVLSLCLSIFFLILVLPDSKRKDRSASLRRFFPASRFLTPCHFFVSFSIPPSRAMAIKTLFSNAVSHFVLRMINFCDVSIARWFSCWYCLPSSSPAHPSYYRGGDERFRYVANLYFLFRTWPCVFCLLCQRTRLASVISPPVWLVIVLFRSLLRAPLAIFCSCPRPYFSAFVLVTCSSCNATH